MYFGARTLLFGRGIDSREGKHCLRQPDDVDHFGTMRDRRLVGAVHVLHAKPDAGDLQTSQPASFPGGVIQSRIPFAAGHKGCRGTAGRFQKPASPGLSRRSICFVIHFCWRVWLIAQVSG